MLKDKKPREICKSYIGKFEGGMCYGEKAEHQSIGLRCRKSRL